MLFFVYRGDFSGLRIDINAQAYDPDAMVVFLPLQKKVVQQQNKKSKLKRAAINNERDKEIKKKIEKKVAQKSPTMLAQAIAKKVVPKKKLEKKPVVQEKKVIEEPKQEIKEEVVPQQEEIKEVTTPLPQQVEAEGSNIRYMGQHDLDAMQMQDYISSEIGAHWKPPVGIANNVMCEINIVVNWQGMLQDVRIVTPSGSAMYDVSARSAVLAMQFPKWLWGKEFIISFKQ